MKAEIEYTDTFGGDANYSWVRRGTVKAKTEKGIIRAAKKFTGLNGTPCKKENLGELIAFRPLGICTILFVTIIE